MALLPCPECGRQVSDRARSCPHCGYPVQESIEDALPVEADDEIEAAQPVTDSTPESSWETRPSFWGPSLDELADMHRATPFPHGVDPSSLSEAEMDAIGDYVGALFALRDANRIRAVASGEAGRDEGWLRGLKTRAALGFAEWQRKEAQKNVTEIVTRLQSVSSRWTYTIVIPTTGLLKVFEIYGMPVWGLLGEAYPALADFCSEQ